MKDLKTIDNNATVIVEEKKSRFIANIFRVNNVEEAEKRLQEIRKKYYDARHNCYAYVIDEDGIQKKKFSDDGEPSGTAGSPILNVIEKNELCNVLIIVTRYFGGILLGAGGLVRAYTEAAAKAINETNILEKEEGYEIEIVITYQDLDKFKYYCTQNKIDIINIAYLENIICRIELTKEEMEKLEKYKYNEMNINILEYRLLERKLIDKRK